MLRFHHSLSNALTLQRQAVKCFGIGWGLQGGELDGWRASGGAAGGGERDGGMKEGRDRGGERGPDSGERFGQLPY